MINVKRATEFFAEVDHLFDRPARIVLVGETTQLFEGWQRWNTQLDFFCDAAPEDRSALKSAVEETAASMGLTVSVEYPGDIIPLPDNYNKRSRALTDAAWCRSMQLEFRHFDPYSVSYRFLARGGKPDYDIVLQYLERGWINEPELCSRLDDLLPRLTFETIQQDPAEFRRRYSGLQQMWRARQVTINESMVNAK